MVSKFDYDTVDKKELDKCDATIQKYLKDSKKHLKALSDMTFLFVKPKLKSKLATFSPDVYSNHAKAQNDIVSRLPQELQRNVWRYLHTDQDRIVFALTCKWHAAMYENLRTDSTQPQLRVKGIQKTHRLAVLLAIGSWMPKTHRLCYMCTQYKVKQLSKDNWGGNSQVDVIKPGMAKLIEAGPRCPACVLRGKVELVSHRQACKELKKLLQESVGLR